MTRRKVLDMPPEDVHNRSMTNMTRFLTITLLTLLLAACGKDADTPRPSLVTPTTTTSTTAPDAHNGQSAIYPGDHADYRDGAWWVDGVKVTGVDCPTDDSCYPMEHDGGIMIHEDIP